jgi:hypothetical protein
MGKVIGIDPGVLTGIAEFSNGQLVSLITIHPLDLREMIKATGATRVIYEDSRLTSHLFTTNSNPAVAKNMARKVGQVDMVCGLIVAACERIGIPAHGVSPKNKGAKLDAEKFKAMTGWTGPSNQHTRDAAVVAWAYRSAK